MGSAADATDDGFELTRRGLLAAAVCVGGVGSLTGAGTRMTLSDRSVFANNRLEGGGLDLGLAWAEYQNGAEEPVEQVGDCGADSAAGYTDNSAPVIELDAVEPGDFGTLEICLWTSGAVDSVWLRLQVGAVAENGVTDTEADAGDDPESDVGELQEYLDVTVGQSSNCEDARADSSLGDGSLATVGAGALGTGVQLPASTRCLAVQWRLPEDDVSPTILTDVVEFSIELSAEQSRHNESTNPWANSD